MDSSKDFARNLIQFIDSSYTGFHAVKNIETILKEEGFNKLEPEEKWGLEKEGSYYVSKNNSALMAFKIGRGEIEEDGFRIIGSHTDSPAFKIKPSPEIAVEGKYLKLNTEVYGGPILSTWFDRPLSLAGRVSIRDKDPFKPREELINLDQLSLVIPNLAIHMNRQVNEGVKINPQKDTLPLLSTINSKFEKEKYLLKLIGENLKVDMEDILDFELFLYSREKGCLVGIDEEFISSGRLDNLGMVHASLHGLLDSKTNKATKILVAFDNEEVGSGTKQGAASPMLRSLVERISLAMKKDREDFHRALASSFIISADQAHAVHPNYGEKADPTNRPIINGGPVIKLAANQSYTSDSYSSAVYKAICKSAKLPVQEFVNRSDIRGGSTIGPISSRQLDISSIDMGNPILAMHSIRELGGVKDHHYAYQSFREFYGI